MTDSFCVFSPNRVLTCWDLKGVFASPCNCSNMRFLTHFPPVGWDFSFPDFTPVAFEAVLAFCLCHPLPHSLSHVCLSWVNTLRTLSNTITRSPLVSQQNDEKKAFRAKVIQLALPTYCCSHRVAAGNRLPLCENELGFICQVPNLIIYPNDLQTLHYHLLIDKMAGLSIPS